MPTHAQIQILGPKHNQQTDETKTTTTSLSLTSNKILITEHEAGKIWHRLCLLVSISFLGNVTLSTACDLDCRLSSNLSPSNTGYYTHTQTLLICLS